MDEVRREAEEASVDVGTMGQATNSVILEEQWPWICGSGMF